MQKTTTEYHGEIAYKIFKAGGSHETENESEFTISANIKYPGGNVPYVAYLSRVEKNKIGYISRIESYEKKAKYTSLGSLVLKVTWSEYKPVNSRLFGVTEACDTYEVIYGITIEKNN